jgi:hypothetical protein
VAKSTANKCGRIGLGGLGCNVTNLCNDETYLLSRNTVGLSGAVRFDPVTDPIPAVFSQLQ